MYMSCWFPIGFSLHIFQHTSKWALKTRHCELLHCKACTMIQDTHNKLTWGHCNLLTNFLSWHCSQIYNHGTAGSLLQSPATSLSQEVTLGYYQSEKLLYTVFFEIRMTGWLQIWPIKDPELSFADISSCNDLSFRFSAKIHLISIHWEFMI